MTNKSKNRELCSHGEKPDFNLSISNNGKSKQAAKLTALLAISLFVLLFPVIGFAQAVSGVTGVVSDSGGAIIPGTQVMLLDTKTSREFTTTANDQGVYV